MTTFNQVKELFGGKSAEWQKRFLVEIEQTMGRNWLWKHIGNRINNAPLTPRPPRPEHDRNRRASGNQNPRLPQTPEALPGPDGATQTGRPHNHSE